MLDTPVDSVRRDDGVHVLVGAGRTVTAYYVVNAAGLFADTIDRLFGYARFTVTPRRGELIVFDKLARTLMGDDYYLAFLAARKRYGLPDWDEGVPP